MTELNYAPASRRRRALWRVVAAVLVFGTLPAAWRFAPPLCRHARYRHWQSRCLRFDYPPETVVFDDDPARCAALSAGEPGQFRAKRRAAYPALVRLPPACAAPAGIFPSDDGIAFLHERTTASGSKVLVLAVYYVGREQEGGHDVTLEVVIMAPAGLRPGSRMAHVGEGEFLARAGRGPLRLLAGQPDPADPSRFTIAYDAGGRRRLIEGTVLDAVPRPSTQDSAGYCGNVLGCRVDLRMKPEE